MPEGHTSACQSQANDLEISKGVRAVVEEMKANLPEGTEMVVAVDNSLFTAEAIHEVWVTIGIAIARLSTSSSRVLCAAAAKVRATSASSPNAQS